MKNMADAIESFIIGQLLADRQNAVLVQRNELADRLSCAPSQISYVLSTRFTPERGYLVESRRGSGGFIRIVRILPVEDQRQEPAVEELLQYWHKNRMLTDREYELLHYLTGIMDISEREKHQILRQAVKRMVEAG
jgi:transcriptional regulator CtsR